MMNAIVTLMLFAAVTDDAAALKDQQQFNGDWEVVRLEAKGGPVKDSPIAGITFKPFKKSDEKPGKAKGVFTYTLDPAKTPRRIDARSTLDDKESMYGIYQFDGGTLKLCLSRAEKTRPTEFKTAADSDVLLLELKRKPVAPERLSKLAARLGEKDHEARTAALAELTELVAGRSGSEAEFEPLVEPLFQLAGWGGRSRDNARAAEALIARIGRLALPVLKLRLKSADDHDRRVAAELLARIGPADAALVALLRPLLDDRDQYVRQAAIEGLGAAGPAAEKAVADLERVASNDPILLLRVGTRIALVRVAGASDERVRALAAFLEMKDELDAGPKGEQKQSAREAAVSAAAALGNLGTRAKAATPRLLAALKEPTLRYVVADTFGRIGATSPDAVAVLVDLVKNDPTNEGRRAAAGSLGAFGPAAKEAIPALRDALKGDGKGGWWVAAETLGKIGGKDVVPVLTGAVAHGDDDIRLTAMRALGDLGVLAKPAVPVLEKASKEDASERNRAAAAEALRKIGAADDTERLQGKWAVLTARNNGGDIFAGKRDGMVVIIEKGELRVVIEGTKSEQAATFTLDPTQTPKQIEFTKETRDSAWEGFKGKVVTGFEHLPYKLFQSWKLEEKTLNVAPAKDKMLGIYELKDDTLKICWRTTPGRMGDGKEATIRPGNFQSDVYYHEILFELRRVKSDK